MRSLSVLALGVFLSGAAFASFDLMLIPNATDGYSRFDPINRVGLGTIFMSTARNVTAVAARPDGLFSYNGGTQRINWSTGERLSIPSLSSSAYNLSENGLRYARVSGGQLQLGAIPLNSDPTTSASTSLSFSVVSATELGPDRWIAYGTSAAGLVAQVINDAGQTISAVSTLIASGSLTNGTVGQGTVVRRATDRYFAIPYRDNNGAHRLGSASVSLNGALIGAAVSQTLGGFSIINANTTLAATRGHTGLFVVGADATTPTSARIAEFDDSPTYFTVTSYTTSAFSPVVSGRWQMANIIAPEPGTMIALGAGLVAILRRRKKA